MFYVVFLLLVAGLAFAALGCAIFVHEDDRDVAGIRPGDIRRVQLHRFCENKNWR